MWVSASLLFKSPRVDTLESAPSLTFTYEQNAQRVAGGYPVYYGRNLVLLAVDFHLGRELFPESLSIVDAGLAASGLSRRG